MKSTLTDPTTLSKTYEPARIEPHWTMVWEKYQLAKPGGQGEPYCIVLPPPNVTGTLHMGHGFQQTLMDALVRYHRMMGKNVLWVGGTDHAGIATQMVVERQLWEKNKQKRTDMTREAFIEKVWEWKEQSGNTIVQQMKRMGLMIDWSRERFSMDHFLTRATVEAFRILYEEGLIYKGKRLVNWDPKLQTAISDLEVESKEVDGFLWYIRYPIVGQKEHLVVATTRPETLLGDTAVAVNPEDERYRQWIGYQVQVPFTGRTVPIIADSSIDAAFGTGCVKITPAHDFNDAEMGKRHQLPVINILTTEAKLNETVPEPYRGLDRFEARSRIVADCETLGLIEKIEPHRHMVPHGDRSGVILEPLLTDQWFVKMAPLAQKALHVQEKGELKFIPNTWEKIYLQWLENIEDWCISRQLWWGHRIPVWTDPLQNIYVGENELEVREHYKLPDNLPLEQDPDVLDTWFSASLWPLGTLGWPEKTSDFRTFYPTQVLVTGFDIIFFWVARMVMMGLKLAHRLPFMEVYVTGLIRDNHGQKMSKSKGNILDPIDMVDGIDLDTLIKKRTTGLMQPQHAKSIETTTRQDFPQGITALGTDALRMTFCGLATLSREVNFDMSKLEGYRLFCNKLWNAARFVLMNTATADCNWTQPLAYRLPERWIRSELQHLIEKAHLAFQNYRFDLLIQDLYDFTWGTYCDWYVELAKCTLNDPGANTAEQRATRMTLLECLETLLRLFHPIAPFITEDIWQKVGPLLDTEASSILMLSYPTAHEDRKDHKATQDVQLLKSLITAIRTLRSENNISPAKNITVLLRTAQTKNRKQTQASEFYLLQLAKISHLEWITKDASIPPSATTVVNDIEIYIPLAGLIDRQEEMKRLEKAIQKQEADIAKMEAKLKNPSFVQNAPPAVVEQENQRYNSARLSLAKLKEQCETMKQM